MLYYNFKNYEEFKESFGVQKHENGKSRRNKILLAFIKNRELLHEAVLSGDYSLIHIEDMSQLKRRIWDEIEEAAICTDATPYKVELIDCALYSSQYETDGFRGICEDGDTRSVRYINHKSNDRVFKMKSGTVFTKIFQSGDCAWCLLNFVKNQKGFAVSDFAVSKQRNFVYNTFCVIIVIKNGCKLAVSLKVYVADVFKIFFTELSEGMSFTALTHTGKNQRFSSAAVFPFN